MSDLPTIGILGRGYVGGRLAEGFCWPRDSWATSREGGSRAIGFDWMERSQWDVVPDLCGVLVLTIPPVIKVVAQEAVRLDQWGAWMRKHRPGYQRLVYVSTTGVYPDRPGLWAEGDAGGEADEGNEGASVAGRLRLMTERVLGEYFELSVVRAGGIYGPGRNIVTRVMRGGALASRGGGRKVGRIHVDDLAGVIRALVLREEGLCVNAVDDEAATSLDLLEWVGANAEALGVSVGEIEEAIKECEQAGEIPVGGDRLMSNQRMREVLGYALKYPTYREGLGAGL